MKPATILIADDDRAIRTVLTQALGRAGYDTKVTAHAGTLWRSRQSDAQAMGPSC